MGRFLNLSPALGALATFSLPLRIQHLLASLLVAVAVFGSLYLLVGGHDSVFLLPANPDRIPAQNGPGYRLGSGPTPPRRRPTSNHPIDRLIGEARVEFNQLLGKRSFTLEQAASRYRERRGRHPPPGFDRWFAAATEMNAVIIEDFFDRIHHDINPFWGLEPHEIRARAHDQPYIIRVRNGTAEASDPEPELHFRVAQWLRLVRRFANHLPDMDLYMNHMDESRVMMRWEDMAKLIAEEQKTRTFVNPYDAISTYGGVADVEGRNRYDPHWLDHDVPKFWDFTRDACPPDSPGRNISSLPSLEKDAEYPDAPMPQYTYKGYIKNFTAAMDPCLQPHLRGMHGTYIEAISMSTTRELVPIFGECKLPPNNEILIPSAMYIAEDIRKEYSGGGERGGPWSKKKDAVVWRGSASGLRNKAENWWHNHRHRFIQMLNATTLGAIEAGDTGAARTFRLLSPDKDPYNIRARREGRLAEWVSTWSDVAFTDLLCWPPEDGEDGKPKKTCRHNDDIMSVAPGIPFKQLYDYKYLPDIDGNSFSGRYRAFLMSTSMPLKSTIYAEWHDDRLKPWVHFVPFDNSYMDIYGIMDYFLNGHDQEAETIALDGQAWATAVLRVEDMALYTWRLLLEYARVMDDNRDRLAFVDDLLK
ncbi:hypothetical protein VTJ49DRAFT_5170 [Mycothermus thermophilus]|uniref:Glycosyl transferase CAP10 domain-containing protein n=1 Tax=Humicola insolens TaxID=85995 RepID=A0ABR3V3W1_HUMIN